jgi:hypothetical protein
MSYTFFSVAGEFLEVCAEKFCEVGFVEVALAVNCGPAMALVVDRGTICRYSSRPSETTNKSSRVSSKIFAITARNLKDGSLLLLCSKGALEFTNGGVGGGRRIEGEKKIFL